MNNFVESKMAAALGGIVDIQRLLLGLSPETKSVGQQILEHDNYQAFRENKSELAQIELKTAITRTGLVGDPLVGGHKPAIDPGVRRTLTVRGLVRQYNTESGAIEMPLSPSKTINAAGVVAGSPEQSENVTIPESVLEFTNSFVPVVTISHMIPASTPVLDDSEVLSAFINGEMTHGLALAVENELVNGAGTTGRLSGLLLGATAYVQTSPALANELDILRDAIEQCQIADFSPDAILLHPTDWRAIEIRHTATGSSDYAAGAPRLVGTPSLWGIRVIPTNTIAAGTFLCGDFAACGALFVRQGATVELSRMDSTNFRTGMVTIRAQERMAFVLTNPTALVTGAL